MIIIEGNDNTGKTTLQQAILREFPQTIAGYNPGRPPKDRQEYMDKFWEFLGKDPLHTHNVVFDRFYFSEFVYGPILRGKVIFTDAENQLVKKLLDQHRPLIIYCYRSAEQILATFDEREQLEGVKESVEEILRGYEVALASWIGKENFVLYDHGNPLSVATTWKRIKEYLGYYGEYVKRPRMVNEDW